MDLEASPPLLGRLGGHLGRTWRPSWANVAILEAILSSLGGFFEGRGPGGPSRHPGGTGRITKTEIV
eukprot:8168698-Pyramimonas_sp.AAC.1